MSPPLLPSPALFSPAPATEAIAKTETAATSTPARRPPRPQSAFDRNSPRDPRPQSAFERPSLFARKCRIYPFPSSVFACAMAHMKPQSTVEPAQRRLLRGTPPPPEGSGQGRFTRSRYVPSPGGMARTRSGPLSGPAPSDQGRTAASVYCTELSAHAASLQATSDQAASLQATVPQAADAQAASAHAASLHATPAQAASDQAAVSHVGLARAAVRQAVALNTVVPSTAVVR